MKTFRYLTCAACVLFTSVAAHAQQKPVAQQLRGFSVVLVQGDQEGTSSELPAAARAAINDVKDFLPFKSYRLLDTSWTLGSNTTQEFTSRLRGENQDYEVRISSRPEDPASVGVKFILRERGESSSAHHSSQRSAGGQQGAPSEELEKAEAELSELRVRLSRAQTLQQRGLVAPSVAAELQTQVAETENRVAQLKQQGGSDPAADWFASYASALAPPIIDTSFSMRIGETVVVGTSRVRGNKALIALLTAVPGAGKESGKK